MRATLEYQTSQTLFPNRHGKYTTVEHTWPAGHKEELDILSSYIHPTIISLQETFLKENKIVTFKGYSSYHNYASEINGVVHGGSAILVNSTPHRQLNLQTCLQAVAIRVTLCKTITVCSIYLPPSVAFNSNNFNDLLSQLPSPVLITSNFNWHSTLWHGTKLDRRGKMVEDILTKHNLCVLNYTSPTYIHLPQVHLRLLILVYVVRIFFWTYSGKHSKTCVAVIIIRSQYPMVPQNPHLLFLAGNYVKLTGRLSLRGQRTTRM